MDKVTGLHLYEQIDGVMWEWVKPHGKGLVPERKG